MAMNLAYDGLPSKAWYALGKSTTSKLIFSFRKLLGVPKTTLRVIVRPDMRYYSRSRCFHPDPGMKHISVPPRHMTLSYAPDFQHDITTLQLHGYNISYNRHTTALNTLHQRKIHD